MVHSSRANVLLLVLGQFLPRQNSPPPLKFNLTRTLTLTGEQFSSGAIVRRYLLYYLINIWKKKLIQKLRKTILASWPTCACSYRKLSSHLGGIPVQPSESTPRKKILPSNYILGNNYSPSTYLLVSNYSLQEMSTSLGIVWNVVFPNLFTPGISIYLGNMYSLVKPLHWDKRKQPLKGV